MGQGSVTCYTSPRSPRKSLRLFDEHECPAEAPDSEAVFAARIREADEYYESVSRVKFSEAEWGVVRQAPAGLLWSKQFYHYVVADWLAGDPAGPTPPASRLHGRNKNWTHVYSRDVISKASFRSYCSTSLGGSTAKMPMARTCSQVVSSGSITSGRSIARRFCRTAPRSGRPMVQPGWRFTA